MRKQEKFITNGAIYGGIGFFLLDLVNQYLDTRKKDIPFWENYDGRQAFFEGLKGVLFGGAIGWAFHEIQKWDEKDLPFCPDNHLHQILSKSSMNNDPTLLAKGKEIIKELKDFFVFEYNEMLVDSPRQFGSTVQRTAIGGSSDFDLLVPFRKGTMSLEGIYEDAYCRLQNKFINSCFELRKQRHSIGLSYDDGKNSIHFDIVTARERNDYFVTGDLTIQRRAMGTYETPTHIKTNIWKKNQHVVNRPEVRRIVRLLKIYNKDNNIGLNPTAITTLVKDAHDKNAGYVNSSVFNNLTLSMSYIADQVLNRQNLKDVANSNINLLGDISPSKREQISNFILSDLNKINNNPNYLKEIYQL